MRKKQLKARLKELEAVAAERDGRAQNLAVAADRFVSMENPLGTNQTEKEMIAALLTGQAVIRSLDNDEDFTEELEKQNDKIRKYLNAQANLEDALADFGAR